MSGRRSFHDRVRDVCNAPPLYVRIFGGLFLLGSLGEYLAGPLLYHLPRESVLELLTHVFFLLAGMLMIYPEGAVALMAFARKTLPRLPGAKP